MQRGVLLSIGFVTLFFLLVASCMLLDVPLFHDSRLMSKWFGCYAAILVLSASLFWWNGTRATSVRIADLAVVVLAIYICTSDYCRGDLSGTVLLRGLSLLLLYLIFRQSIGGKLLVACMAVFFTLAVVLAMWGMVQFVLAVAHEVPLHTAVTGNFDNTAGFALALSLSLPVGIYLLRLPEYVKGQRLCIAIALGVVALALVLSLSRTGWLSIVCTGIYAYCLLGKRKRQWTGLLLLATMVLFAIFYLYKQDSADGRSYIALCTVHQIADSPWWGHGRYGFTSGYMEHQAGYLSLHPDSRFAWLADTVYHPLNEWLHLVVRYGIVGFLLLVGTLLCLVPAIRHEVAERRILPVGLLVAFLPFTLFSYPLHYPLAWVLLIMATAMQARHTKVLFSLSAKRAVPLLALSLMCAASPLLYRTIHAEWEWYDVATRSLSGQTRYVMPWYEALYGRLKHSPHFLYNYAAELNYIGEYTHSQQILDECMQRMDDYDTRLLAASNHEHIGNYDLAEKHYRKASAMCPVRFVPLYRLAKLYGKTGRYGDQRNMAQQIMDKEVKVPSQHITEIKDEMRYLLEETDFK